MLDPTFGSGGQLTTASLDGMAVQPDSKIVVLAGESLLRYNPDGSGDTRFNGLVSYESLSHHAGLGHLSMALQSDGKIVVAAVYDSGLILDRFQADGDLDPGFGTSGETTPLKVGGDFIAIQPDGKMVVAGTGTVARFNADGSLDKGFGSNGVFMNFGAAQQGMEGLALQADGKVLVLTETAPGRLAQITRLNSDGTMDSSFGNAGQQVLAVPFSGMALQPDGRIILVGGASNAFGLSRLNSNGTFDTTFGADGRASADFGPGSYGSDLGVAIQPDGRIIAVGNTGTDTQRVFSSFGLIRYNPDGSLDVSFGAGGKVITTVGDSNTRALANTIAIQPDGKILVAGPTFIYGEVITQDSTITRYLGDTPVADANQRFVKQIYLDLLQRPVDPPGLSAWSNVLAQGVSRTQVVQGIESSPEYEVEQVQKLYGFLLNRSADSSGLMSWVSFLNQGGRLEQVEAKIAGSDEYLADRAGGTTNGFLQALYADVLQRQIDPSGSQFWGQGLASGLSRSSVAAAVLASLESETAEVQALYRQLLRRAADSSGLNMFTSDLQQGVSNEDVLAAIAGSDEYFGRL